MAGCSSSADTMPSQSPSTLPTATAAPSPSVTVFPSASSSPAASEGVATIEDAKRVSGEIEEELGKLSELSEPKALAAGQTAVISIGYDSAYQAGLTTRLSDMVEERVQSVDASLENVIATDDAALTQQIGDLREQLENDELTYEQLTAQLEQLTMAIGGASGTGAGIGSGAGTGTGGAAGTGTGSGTGTGLGTGTDTTSPSTTVGTGV